MLWLLKLLTFKVDVNFVELTTRRQVARVVFFVIVRAEQQKIFVGKLSHADVLNRGLDGGRVKKTKTAPLEVENLEIIIAQIGYKQPIVRKPGGGVRPKVL